MRLDALKSRELRATIFALRGIDKTIQKMVRVQTKAVVEPEWKKALAERADTRIEHRMLVDTAVISVSNQNVRIKSAGKGRPLSGGLAPKIDYPAAEFGVKHARKSYYRTSRKGGSHKVTRVTGTAFKARRKTGYVFYPAAREMIPRLASLWVQTTVHTIANALEGKEE